jgi:AraC-like DNA-binding protein
VTYRELAPTPELRGLVRAYFSFTPGAACWRGQRTVVREVRFTREESFCSPVFADGHASLVIDLGATCRLGQGWTSGTPVRARAIGALRAVGGEAGSDRSEMVGVYFEPGSTAVLLHMPAVELTDRVVDLEQVWGSQSARLAEDLAELDEAARVDRLEAVLVERLRRAPGAGSSLDIEGLARWVRAKPISMTVHRLADAAGVSRQHLTRVFRHVVGVSPKRYSRLARFRAGLMYAGAGAGVKWAEAAAELGYADQSHMIAEFRELSSLTPEALATRQWFHPFILEARARFTCPPGISRSDAGTAFTSRRDRCRCQG